MKKIIAAFDGLNYSKSTRDYAITFARETGAHLVGVFLDDPAYTSFKIYELVTEKGFSEEQLNERADKDNKSREAAAHDFEKACRHSHLDYSIHHDLKLPIRELKRESIYADMLLIDASEKFTHHPEKLPTQYIKDLLGDVQCPVILVPRKSKPVEKVVMLYDGSPSSVYAVKMFSYMLPWLKLMPTDVVSVIDKRARLYQENKRLMKELMKRHFPRAKYIVRKGTAETEIAKYLDQQAGSTLVVMGAYQRSTVSRWFHESMADFLMKEGKLPLFIAHHK